MTSVVVRISGARIMIPPPEKTNTRQPDRSGVMETAYSTAFWGEGNQSIGPYLSVYKGSFNNPPTNRRLEEAVVVDWSKMMKFKAS
ncbi:hypothetical protein AVEN_252925-1 [Araneus ventricosus]|uniref:Uncharacterized protein n=1 Tax=Araneus ventricosus TaxID=182803 RepID=A0A4Y2FDH2_ARAVE|nr:hypothetical protein AVEN_252925-1 [Araneus ventricosus]